MTTYSFPSLHENPRCPKKTKSSNLRKTNKSVLYRAAMLLCFSIVPAYLLLHLVHTSPLPANDYWDLIIRIFDRSGNFHPPGMLSRSNEHFVPVPFVIYLLNAKLTGGSNVALTAWSLAVSGLQVFFLWRLLPEETRESRSARLAAAILLTTLSFTPHAIHNFLHGFSGVMWLTANLFVVSSLYAFKNHRTLGAVALALLASLSYSTGLLVWFVLVMYALMARRSLKETAAIFIVGMLVFLIFLTFYDRPYYHPRLNTNPLHIIRISANLLASPWTNKMGISFLIASLGIPIFIFFAWRSIIERRVNHFVWVSLGAYALLVSLSIGVGRAGLGGHVGFSSRYASLPGFFWMAVFVLGTPYLHRHTLKLAIVFSAAVVNIVTAHNDVRNYVELQAFKELQAIAIRLGVPGCGRNRGFKPWPTDNPHTLSFSCNPHALEKLKAMGHYPFNRHFTVDRGLIDRTFDPGKSEGTFVESPIKRIAPIANTGTSKGCPHQQGKAAMVIGSIPPSIYKFGQIILIDQKNRVIGAAIPEQVLRGFTWCSPSNGRFTRWIGIARLPSTSTNLRAIVFIKP